MSVTTLNNSIKSYYEFFNQLRDHPGSSEIQTALAAVKMYYNNYKKVASLLSPISQTKMFLFSNKHYIVLLSFQ